MSLAPRFITVARALALLVPVAACDSSRSTSGASTTQSAGGDTQLGGVVSRGAPASVDAGNCPLTPPAAQSACINDTYCIYDQYTNQWRSESGRHGDTQCVCAESRWLCNEMQFVGPLPPPELEQRASA